MILLNIVIPMAGEGSRFKNAGFKDPKPLIMINDQRMIELVVNNLRPNSEHRFIFICRKEHEVSFGLDRFLRRLAPGCEVLFTEGLTEGAASTVLLAKDLINNNNPLLIANSDQFIDFEIDTFLSQIKPTTSGSIMTMKASGDKWSYVTKNAYGFVAEVVEKVQVSDEATVGIYYFQFGNSFVQCAEEMIHFQEKSNGEYYVAPVYNKLIHQGHLVEAISVGKISTEVFGLGTPEDLQLFLDHKISTC